MANAEKYANWIVNNADKKGTPEFETVRKAYQAAKIDEQQPSKPASNLTEQQLQAQNKAFPESVFGSRAINKPTTAGEMLQRQDPIAVGQIAEVANIVGGKDGATNVAKRFGVSPQDPRFQAGQLTTDIGLGLAVPASGAAVASKIPAIAKYAPAIASSGADLAGAKTANVLTNLGLRAGIGAGTGAITSGLINPEDIGTGAILGGVLGNVPTAFTALADRGSRRLMQSAIKPQVKYLEAGKVPDAIETMFEYGVNPTQGRTIFGKGLDVIKKDVNRLNSLIDEIVKTSPNPVKVETALKEIEALRPQIIARGGSVEELDALTKFITSKQANPLLSGDFISAPAAQEMKKGITRTIGEPAYLKDVTSANLQGEKALARGLRKGLVEAVPEIAPINAKEAKAINALKVSERRALNEANKDIIGLGSISPNIEQTLLFLADRSAGMKSIVARMLNSLGKQRQNAPQGLLGVAPAIASGQEQ
jgi:hypothetical protein